MALHDLKDPRIKGMQQKLEGVLEEYLEECGCCGSYHFPWFHGDCRDDLNRLASSDEIAHVFMKAINQPTYD
jgi:hypothetical protein